MPVARRAKAESTEHLQTGVYCWLNKVNGKVYVGSATRSFNHRKRRHLDGLRKGQHPNIYLQRAYCKHGEDVFEFKVLERCLPSVSIAREQFWIDNYHATDPNLGYNISKVAGSSLGLKRSDETKAKISAASKKSLANPDTKAKQSSAQKKANTPEVIAKRSMIAKKRLADPEARAKISAWTKAAMADPEIRAKISAAKKKHCADPRVRAKMSAAQKKVMSDPEVKAKHSAKTKEAMADPEIRARLLAGVEKREEKKKQAYYTWLQKWRLAKKLAKLVQRMG